MKNKNNTENSKDNEEIGEYDSLAEASDEEIDDNYIQSLAEYYFEYLFILDFRKLCYDNLKNEKVIDFGLYLNYREILNSFCSNLANAEFVFDFENDLKKIWDIEDIYNFEFYYINNCLCIYNGQDDTINNDPELSEQIKVFKNKNFQYFSTTDQINKAKKFLKRYRQLRFESDKDTLLSYKGKNEKCHDIIESLKDVGFFNSESFDELSETISFAQPEQLE